MTRVMKIGNNVPLKAIKNTAYRQEKITIALDGVASGLMGTSAMIDATSDKPGYAVGCGFASLCFFVAMVLNIKALNNLVKRDAFFNQKI